ncbi:MAG: ATP-binding cassette, subfamily bacterial [Chloroflexota bacterium]|nr:ATP-binding cassette, subfamily bacterial [Chloroflexota bacterium]
MRGGGRGGPWRQMFDADVDNRRVPKERRGRTVRRIAEFFRPYRLAVAAVLATIVITSLLGIINPYLLKLLIDDALPQRDFGLLNLFVGLMILVPIVAGLIGIGQSYLNNVIGQRVMQDLRNALYEHLQRLPLRFFTDTRTGEIQSRLSNDVGGVQSVVTDTASSTFANVVIVVSTVLAMLLLDWRLTALSLALMPFFMYLTYRVGKIRRRLSGMTQASLADMSAITEETVSVSGVLLTKTFGQQEPTVGRFREASARLARLQIQQSMVGRWFFMIVGTVFSITPAFVYWLAGYLAITGDNSAPTVGDIVAFTTLQSRLFFPLGQLLNVQVEVQGALALFDRIFEYLDLPAEIADAPDAVALDRDRLQGRIRFRHVSFRYRGTPPAVTDQPSPPDERIPFGLDDIDFEAAPGQLVALVGPSGSGKTTTTYLLPRLYDVDEGAVEIDGVDVRKLRLADLGQVIGFVTQETFLFHASVRQNLRYARPDATDAELEAAARMAAIHERVNDLPHGYDTIVGERGYKLSGGEKQRVALARVLLKDPRILVLDEATSALDTVSERLIQTAMERAMKGRTTIAIAHRLSTILRADLILVFERGRVIERGRHDELLAHGGLYAQLYREQFESMTGAEPGAEPAPV